MTRRAWAEARRWLATAARFVMAWLLLLGGSAAAQTTVVLDLPGTHVTDTMIRNGAYVNVNSDGSSLLTRASSNAPDWERRTILKFDTKYTIPEHSVITSATLTLTVRSGLGNAGATRKVAAYGISSDFQAADANWNRRKATYNWTTPGGDVAEQYYTAKVSNVAGSKASFNLTTLVKRAVNGELDSRYTRVELVDVDSPATDPEAKVSYREYHSSEASDPSVRPKLVVVYAGVAPPPPPPPPSGSTLRVLQWNIAQGYGTDGKSNLDRVVSWIIKMKPDVISFNEVMRYSNGSQPQIIADKLKAQTGESWTYQWVQKWGATSGEGEAVMSRVPFVSTGSYLLSYERSVAQGTIVVNGRVVNVFSTHLDHQYSSRRVTQVQELKAWAKNFSEQRLIAGDINGWPGTSESTEMTKDYYDGWAVAKSQGTATAYPSNPDGNTRNTRIDYVFHSKGATALVVKGAQVFDTRDSSGFRPSDHNPLVVTIEVR